jgi:hypothetical protein
MVAGSARCQFELACRAEVRHLLDWKPCAGRGRGRTPVEGRPGRCGARGRVALAMELVLKGVVADELVDEHQHALSM